MLIELAGVAADDRPTQTETILPPRSKRTTGKPRASSREGAESKSHTTGRQDGLGRYLEEIGPIPVLDGRDEEVELAKKIEAGVQASQRLADPPKDYSDKQRNHDRNLAQLGDSAKSKFFEANLKLVVSIAKKYPTLPGIELLDVIQEGNIGLNHAIDKFEWRKGFKFSTYASWWIRQAIDRGITNQSKVIRVPIQVDQELRRLDKVRKRIESEKERPATFDELVNDLDIEPDRLRHLMQTAANATTVSFDRPLREDGDTTFADVISDPAAVLPSEAVESILLADATVEAIKELSPLEREIVVRHFGLHDGRPQPLQEIGLALGMTTENVRRINIRAISILRDPNNEVGIALSKYAE